MRAKTIRELEERAGEAERLEGLIGIACEQIRDMKHLIDQMDPIVAGVPRVAEHSSQMMRENTELRRRAVGAERELALAADALFSDLPGWEG